LGLLLLALSQLTTSSCSWSCSACHKHALARCSYSAPDPWFVTRDEKRETEKGTHCPLAGTSFLSNCQDVQCKLVKFKFKF